jgi:hypothetical protein
MNTATANSIDAITAELLSAVKSPVRGTKPKADKPAKAQKAPKVHTVSVPKVRTPRVPNDLSAKVQVFLTQQRQVHPDLSNYKLSQLVSAEFAISSGNAAYYTYAKPKKA